MADDSTPLIQECPTCAAPMDVSGEEPFALKHCPACGDAVRVRRRFDHFELEEQLGVGGMGTVYRALDRNLGRHVALKLLQREQNTNPEFIAQFAREAAITASINHPHVVKVFSTGQDHGMVYIAMELVGKGSLDELLTAEERLPEERVLTTGIQIAEGLNSAFKRGLIHRDVKPGNILLANAQTAKIVDFGLAVLMEHAGAVMGEVWGTPAYVAPEKLDNQPEDLRSDIYSLGASLFHALAGVPPCDLQTNQMSVLLEAKRELPSLRTVAHDVSEPTVRLIDKALQFDPADRFQTYEELIEALEYARRALLAGGEERMVAPKKKPAAKIFAVAGLVVALAAVAVFFAVRGGRGGQTAEQEEEAKGGGGTDQNYQSARMLLAVDATKAAKAFRALEDLPNVPQPRLNWITLHAGLAEFLAGHVDEGRAEFGKILERGPFSTDPIEKRLADFFMTMAELGAAETAVPADAVRKLKPEGEELIVLLIIALKDWALKDYDNAGTLFADFNSATAPPKPAALPPKSAWVAEYQNLAKPFVDDYEACAAATRTARAATTLPEWEKALAVVEAAGEKLKRPGELSVRLDPLAADLRVKIAKAKDAQAAQHAEQEAAERKAVAELKTRLVALCRQARYAEALAAAKAVQPQNEPGRKIVASMVMKTEWLARFKATLINDLSTTGYTEPVVKTTGLQIPGGVRHASDVQVEVVSQFGSVPVPWADISKDCIFAMGQSFLRDRADADTLADRQWLLGVFALFEGKDAQGRELLIQACRAKDEYRFRLGYFEGIAESL